MQRSKANYAFKFQPQIRKVSIEYEKYNETNFKRMIIFIT